MRLLINMIRCLKNQRDYLQKGVSNMKFNCNKIFLFQTLVCTGCRTVRTDADVAGRTTRGRVVRHVAGSRVDSWHMTWLVCSE
jgi:hypothetical protein